MLEKINLKIVAQKNAVVPAYKTEGSAGADVCALLDAPIVLKRGERALIPTGLSFEIPAGYEIQVRPRSGLALKNGVTVLNSPGTIDSDYRGELKIILANFGQDDFTVNSGDRIAQIVISSVTTANFISVNSISETLRGAGGFGSTGV